MPHETPPPARELSRRDILRGAGLGLAGAALLGDAARAASSPSKANASESPAVKLATTDAPTAAFEPLHRFPRMVHEFIVDRVREAEQAANRRRAALKTKADAEAYVREVQEKIRQSFGTWPEKTPLNARITRRTERETYVIENVIFESRPGFPVTANLYVPKGRAFPLPGVVGSCGHSITGKTVGAYQTFAQALARQGFVTLIFDPIGQGERFQYPTAAGRSRVGAGVSEHHYAGKQQILVGEHFGAWRAWDAIRALDYLLTRPEVDPQHLGITGNSGGGTMTTMLCGLEPRFTMAAPSCFVTTLRRNLENELPTDPESCPPRAHALGLDHSDFIVAMAPKPVALLGQERDFFDSRGFDEACARVQRIYELLDAPANHHRFTAPGYHGFSQELREEMYGWFNRAAKNVIQKTEPAITLEDAKLLWCTPSGQVAELKPRTVFSFTRETSEVLARRRGAPTGQALKALVSDALKMPPREGVPDYRILRPLPPRGYPTRHVGTYAVETEPRVFSLVYRLSDAALVSRPPRGAQRAILYVSHQSGDAELRDEPLLRELLVAEPKSAFFACDVRGVGESRPNTGIRDFRNAHGSDYHYAQQSLMLDRPYVGQKAFDVLRLIDWLKDHGHTEVHLVARGWGAVPATFAALLSDTVTQVTLKHALTSYAAVAESEDYNWPLSTFLPGVLKSFDLPDCYRALGAKRLRQIAPAGPREGGLGANSPADAGDSP